MMQEGQRRKEEEEPNTAERTKYGALESRNRR